MENLRENKTTGKEGLRLRPNRLGILVTCILLIVFWLIIVGEAIPHYILPGIFTAVVIVGLLHECVLDHHVRFSLSLTNIVRLVKYILNLLYEIVKANVQVAQIVLSPKLNITPTFIKFNSKVNKDVTKTILGNSITLTPGTLTIEIEDDMFIVHGLSEAHAMGPLDWHMVDKLVELEEEKN